MTDKTPWEWYGGPFDGGPAEIVQTGSTDRVRFKLTPLQANDGTTKEGVLYEAPVEKKSGRYLILWHLKSVVISQPDNTGT